MEWGPIIFVLFFAFAVLTTLILGSIPDWWPWAKRQLKMFWDSLFDFGIENDPYDRYGQYKGLGNRNVYGPPKPHVHSWVYYTTTKHNWRIVSGKPIGTWNPIDRVIEEVKKRPGHTETKLETLLGWKASGYNIVHTSWNHWKCKVAGCGETKQTEYYCAPAKADGSAYLLTARDLNNDPSSVYDLGNNRFKKTTTRITTWRREIPVEKIKKYGVNT